MFFFFSAVNNSFFLHLFIVNEFYFFFAFFFLSLSVLAQLKTCRSICLITEYILPRIWMNLGKLRKKNLTFFFITFFVNCSNKTGKRSHLYMGYVLVMLAKGVKILKSLKYKKKTAGLGWPIFNLHCCFSRTAKKKKKIIHLWRTTI